MVPAVAERKGMIECIDWEVRKSPNEIAINRRGASGGRAEVKLWYNSSMSMFICSSAAAYIHGAILPVDGGWLAR